MFPVGRLDADTEGLLLLTNDGELANRIAHPRHGLEKEYLASVAGGRVSAGAVRRLRDGVELEDGTTAPARVSQPSPGVLRITIHEGRNRQVRRMCAAVGHPVERLVRTRIGPLSDRRLEPGAWRLLDQAEVRALADATVTPGAFQPPECFLGGWGRGSTRVGGNTRGGGGGGGGPGPAHGRPITSAAVDEAPRANVIGLGLIGGSIALRAARGGLVRDRRRRRGRGTDEALARQVVDARGLDSHAELTFVAVPVHGHRRPGEARAGRDRRRRHRRRGRQGHRDRGDRRSAVRRRPSDGRQRARRARRRRRGDVQRRGVGPHADADDRRRHVRGASPRSSAQLGAEVVAMAPERHDDMVAVVSHVPHLTAASLMGVAADRAEEHAALLRLAAGGFRDMTRVASGHPDIWLDVCAENRPAILSALDAVIGRLAEMREIVRTDARDELFGRLQRARDARTNLPIHATHPQELAEVRIPIPDRTGRGRGDLHARRRARRQHRQLRGRAPRREQRRRRRVLVAADVADLYRGGLLARGFRPAVTRRS